MNQPDQILILASRIESLEKQVDKLNANNVHVYNILKKIIDTDADVYKALMKLKEEYR